MMTKEQQTKKSYWKNELNSLAIEPKRNNELNNNEELADHTDNTKQVYYQDYKTAYGENIDPDDPKFDGII